MLKNRSPPSASAAGMRIFGAVSLLAGLAAGVLSSFMVGTFFVPQIFPGVILRD